MIDINPVSFNLFDSLLTINLTDNERKDNYNILPIEPDKKEEVKYIQEIHELSLDEFYNKITVSNSSVVYLIVEKDPSTSWNLIMPIVYNAQTHHWNIFTSNCSLQGCGGGLNNTISILEDIRKAKRSGYNVELSARICDNEKMRKLRTMQIGIKDLLDCTFPLENYANNQFNEINKTYKEKTIEYK